MTSGGSPAHAIPHKVAPFALPSPPGGQPSLGSRKPPWGLLPPLLRPLCPRSHRVCSHSVCSQDSLSCAHCVGPGLPQAWVAGCWRTGDVYSSVQRQPLASKLPRASSLPQEGWTDCSNDPGKRSPRLKSWLSLAASRAWGQEVVGPGHFQMSCPGSQHEVGLAPEAGEKPVASGPGIIGLLEVTGAKPHWPSPRQLSTPGMAWPRQGPSWL